MPQVSVDKKDLYCSLMPVTKCSLPIFKIKTQNLKRLILKWGYLLLNKFYLMYHLLDNMCTKNFFPIALYWVLATYLQRQNTIVQKMFVFLVWKGGTYYFRKRYMLLDNDIHTNCRYLIWTRAMKHKLKLAKTNLTN